MAFLQPNALKMSTTDTSSPPASPPLEPSPSSPPTARSRAYSPLLLFAGGASFFLLSTVITRRQLLRRYRLTSPAFYRPSNSPPPSDVNGAMEAFEALNLATINVTSFAMMAVGGGLWAFDIQGMADLRQKVRRGIGVEDREDREADEEMEEWLAMVIKRKEGKERRKGEEGKIEGDEEMVGRILKALEEQGGKGKR